MDIKIKMLLNEQHLFRLNGITGNQPVNVKPNGQTGSIKIETITLQNLTFYFRLKRLEKGKEYKYEIKYRDQDPQFLIDNPDHYKY